MVTSCNYQRNVNEMNFLLIIITFTGTTAFWPPPYKVDLHQDAEFYIYEQIQSDDDDNLLSDIDEMIHVNDLQRFNLGADDDKYYRIHQLAMRRNQQERELQIEKGKVFEKPKEIFYEDEPLIWSAGVVDKTGNFVESENTNVRYSNAMAMQMLHRKMNGKRESMEVVANNTKANQTADIAYDYSNFKAEYVDEIKVAAKSNRTLNYTEVKEDESVQQVLKEMVDFKQTGRNCTKEEAKGIGLAAAKCLWSDVNKPGTKSQRMLLIEKITRIALVWFCIYIIIAVPCWCQRGWCCCWFQCRCCKPRRRLDEAKKFLLDNPVGVFINDQNEKVTFRSTVYEKYTQKKLEQALLRV